MLLNSMNVSSSIWRTTRVCFFSQVRLLNEEAMIPLRESKDLPGGERDPHQDQVLISSYLWTTGVSFQVLEVVFLINSITCQRFQLIFWSFCASICVPLSALHAVFDRVFSQLINSEPAGTSWAGCCGFGCSLLPFCSEAAAEILEAMDAAVMDLGWTSLCLLKIFSSSLCVNVQGLETIILCACLFQEVLRAIKKH